MAGQCPRNLAVFKLGGRDFAGEGAVRLVEEVLGGDVKAWAEVFADEEEVKVGRGNDNFYKREVLRLTID